jgi:hypothetical protein
MKTILSIFLLVITISFTNALFSQTTNTESNPKSKLYGGLFFGGHYIIDMAVFATISPEVGYFVTPKSVFGLGASASINVLMYTSTSIFAFNRYTFSPKTKFTFFVESKIARDRMFIDQGRNGIVYYGYGLSFVPGISYNFDCDISLFAKAGRIGIYNFQDKYGHNLSMSQDNTNATINIFLEPSLLIGIFAPF